MLIWWSNSGLGAIDHCHYQFPAHIKCSKGILIYRLHVYACRPHKVKLQLVTFSEYFLPVCMHDIFQYIRWSCWQYFKFAGHGALFYCFDCSIIFGKIILTCCPCRKHVTHHVVIIQILLWRMAEARQIPRGGDLVEEGDEPPVDETATKEHGKCMYMYSTCSRVCSAVSYIVYRAVKHLNNALQRTRHSFLSMCESSQFLCLNKPVIWYKENRNKVIASYCQGSCGSTGITCNRTCDFPAVFEDLHCDWDKSWCIN